MRFFVLNYNFTIYKGYKRIINNNNNNSITLLVGIIFILYSANCERIMFPSHAC